MFLKELRVGAQYMFLNLENAYFLSHPYTVESIQCSVSTGLMLFHWDTSQQVQATDTPDESSRDKGQRP